jgi:heme oxygenase (biliverdin-producing, ferredoxin)
MIGTTNQKKKKMNNNLKELTWENHKKAERTSFIKRLISGRIKPEHYQIYLANQYLMYLCLENQSRDFIDVDFISKIERAKNIMEDIWENSSDTCHILPTTLKYVEYIQTKLKDRNALLAHLYVRHMGDLYGGQIIKKFVPGSGRMYDFDGDVKEIATEFRSMLSDDMVDEANKCFELVIDFLEELEKHIVNLATTD